MMKYLVFLGAYVKPDLMRSAFGVALMGSLAGWLVAVQADKLSVPAFAGIGAAWSVLLFVMAYRYKQRSDPDRVRDDKVEQSVLAGFEALDRHIVAGLNTISNMSAESTLGMVHRVEDLRSESAMLVDYLNQSKIQSDKMQAVIDQNTKIIDYIHEFIRDLAATLEEERKQSNQLMIEVRQLAQMANMIRAIARQTEILAINATVEASRAGEAGRGFAVIAGEVRRLSLQSDDSATHIEQDIKRLITTVQKGFGSDFEARIQRENEQSQNLLQLTEQLTGDYEEMQDFYQRLVGFITENSIKLNANIQALLDMGQYQDVFKQIIDRVHPVLSERHACLAQWLQDIRLPDAALRTAQIADQVQTLAQNYADLEADHCAHGALVDKDTGAELQRIELF